MGAVQTISPIAVEYKGRIFRSILEARWFIVGEVLGWEIHWEPVKSGHQTRYHVDFWSDHLGVFIEIKGSTPLNYEKQQRFAKEKGYWVVVFIGEPTAYEALWINSEGVISREDIDFTKSPLWPKAVAEAMAFEPQWKTPDNVAQFARKPVADPSKRGFHHDLFGAGYVIDVSRDRFLNDIVWCHFVGGRGSCYPDSGVPIRADHVRFVDRKFSGWATGADRSEHPFDYLKTFREFCGYDDRPWFFCLECEKIKDVAAESMDGSDLAIIWRVREDVEVVRYGRIATDYVWKAHRRNISFYCCDCYVRLDSGRVAF